jgi:hypothetical protein
MRILKLIFPVLIICMLTSCKKKELECNEFIRWIENEDNGLRVTKKIDDYNFTLQYKPFEYIFLLENKSLKPSLVDFNARKNEMGGMQYYTLRISSESTRELMNVGNQQETDYYGKLEYFTSFMNDDICLVQNGDTLPCLLFHFERNYGLSPNNDFVLGFESGAKQVEGGERTIIYNDQVLGTGKVKFSISNQDINYAPKLHFN